MWQLDVWQMGGEQMWKFTVMRNGEYEATDFGFTTEKAAQDAAVECLERFVGGRV